MATMNESPLIYTSIDELKSQLNIESGYTDEDSYLESLLLVSESSCNEFTNNGLSGYTYNDIPPTVKHAMILLAAHYYTNRNMVSFSNGVEIPYTFQFLLNPYKNYVIS